MKPKKARPFDLIERHSTIYRIYRNRYTSSPFHTLLLVQQEALYRRNITGVPRSEKLPRFSRSESRIEPSAV